MVASHWMAIILVPGGCALASPPAAALEPWQPDRPSVITPEDTGEVVMREWYGSPMVIADALSLTALFGGFALGGATDSQLAAPLGLAGFAGYLFGGPIVHFSQQRTGIGLASMGLRLGTPVAGATIGMLVGLVAWSGCNKGKEDDFCALEGAAIGLLVGAGTGLFVAAVVDNAALARKPVTTVRFGLRVVPMYRPEDRRTGLSLCGSW
jgi:hypothetical protein